MNLPLAPSGPSSPATATLEGTLDRIVWADPASAFAIVLLAVEGRREPVTLVGPFLGVQPGEGLRVSGAWERHRKYGDRLRVEHFVTVTPATLVGIERYLGSGLVRGLGPSLAKRLVARFGLATLDVIEQEPAKLQEVEGIGPVRSQRICEAWRTQREIKTVMIFLQSHGVSTGFATKIYKTYGSEALAVVQREPFRLATDVYGIGFRTADTIARKLGFAADAPARLEAGVLHALAQAGDQGHVFLPQDELEAQATALLEVPVEGVATAIERLAERSDVVREPLATLRLRDDERGGSGIYLRALWASETGLAARLRTLVEALAPPLEIDVERAVAWFESQEGVELAPRQREAIALAIRSKVLVITGGPGTGKTTLVRGIVRILGMKRRRVLLAAPTGRAAKRLSEATGAEARTLHRLLEFDPQRMAFAREGDNPLAADVVIVDEASMLDTVLAYHLAKAVPDAGQLVFVGDVDQLPSVGPGTVLADLIACGAVPVVRLDEIFRQAARSRIVVNAHRILRGEMPLVEESAGSDFYFIEREEPADIVATLRELVTERIPRRFRLDALDDIQVLTPMRRGELGAATLNVELQAILNPPADGRRTARHLREGDKVMQVRNNYQLEVYNGDIGRVVRLDDEEQQAEILIDGRPVIYDYADLDELVLAYACSIHKAQGSEYPAVVVPLHTQHYVMLQRNLLYTAVTRGRKLVVLVGSKRALGQAVRSVSMRQRWTGLAARLKG